MLLLPPHSILLGLATTMPSVQPYVRQTPPIAYTPSLVGRLAHEFRRIRVQPLVAVWECRDSLPAKSLHQRNSIRRLPLAPIPGSSPARGPGPVVSLGPRDLPFA